MKIRLRFAADGSLTSRIIRFFTWSKISHVDYVFDDNTYYGAMPPTGVNFNTEKFSHVEYYEIEVNDKRIIEHFLLSQKHKKYDWLAIFSIPFRKSWQQETKWICSELITVAIELDTKLFNETPSRITPRDLYIHPLLKRVE